MKSLNIRILEYFINLNINQKDNEVVDIPVAIFCVHLICDLPGLASLPAGMQLEMNLS